MPRGAVQTVSGFLLHAQPYKEIESICTFITPQLGKVRCIVKCQSPEPYREVQLKLASSGSNFVGTDFRYLGSPLVQSPKCSFFSMYVNELTYKLIPTGLMDIEFYGCYMSTLIQLNLPENMQQALRFFEMKLLALNGSSIDFQSDARNAPIEHDKRYSFESSSGFKSSKTGRYTGQLVIGAGNLDSSIQGALAVARECLALQIDALLEGQSLVSRQWRLPKT